MRRLAALLLALATVPAAAQHVDDAAFSREYDAYFEKYAKRYFGPHFDWRWFKAQAITESNLRPTVVSPAGAIGLMQILPSTFEEIRASNPHYTDIRSPRWNIAAGIYYDRYLYRHPKWDPLPDGEQLLVAFAGYNAGLGGVLRAFRRTPPPINSWERVAPRAPRETQNYVKRIVRLKGDAGARRDPARRGASKFHRNG